jgi:hypothetical protein
MRASKSLSNTPRPMSVDAETATAPSARSMPADRMASDSASFDDNPISIRIL